MIGAAVIYKLKIINCNQIQMKSKFLSVNLIKKDWVAI